MGERRDGGKEGAPGGFGVFPDARTVRFERLLPARVERVWGYLTERDLAADWFAEAEIEPREGGAVELRIVVGQVPEREFSGHVARGTVREWRPPKVLSYTWNDENASGALLTFELEPRGERTLLVLTHGSQVEGFLAPNAAGWHAFLDVLDARLRDEGPKPFRAAVDRVLREYERRAGAAANAAVGAADPGEGPAEGALEHDETGRAVLRFERRLAHPIERVWEALDARDVKLEIEAEYAAVVGEERMRSLRSALEELLEHEEGAGP